MGYGVCEWKVTGVGSEELYGKSYEPAEAWLESGIKEQGKGLREMDKYSSTHLQHTTYLLTLTSTTPPRNLLISSCCGKSLSDQLAVISNLPAGRQAR
jgi:hypothetical protein